MSGSDQASQKLKVEWSNVQPSLSNRLRFTTISARPRHAKHQDEGKQVGNVEEAFRTAARVVEADTNGRSSRTPAWPGLRFGRNPGRQRDVLDRFAETAFRAERHFAHDRCPTGQVHVVWSWARAPWTQRR